MVPPLSVRGTMDHPARGVLTSYAMPHRWRSIATSASIFAAAILLAGCEDTEGLSLLAADVAFEPEALDFGEVTVGSAKAQEVVLQNTGSALLALEAVSLDQGFTLRRLKTPLDELELAPGGEITFDVVFLPTEPGEVTGALVVEDGASTWRLPLRGAGTTRTFAQITVEPERLDFGAVTIGATDRRQVRLRNDGSVDGTVDQVVAASDGSPAASGTIFETTPTLPLVVPAGGTVMVEVAFSPASGATFTERFDFVVANQVSPVQLELRGSGTTALGELTCDPSLSFGTVARGSSARQTLTCRTSGGAVQVTGLSVADSTRFGFPNGPGTPASVAGGGRFEVEVAFEAQGQLGPVESMLTVGYQGTGGSRSTQVRLQGTVGEPPPSETAIALQLTWDTRGTDVDLHLTAPGGLPVTSPREMSAEELDCNYGDLARYGGTPDDWGVRGDPSDDCFLDQDDVDGLGPERINMTRAAAGTYRVYVHFFNNNFVPSTGATVDVTLGGQPAGRFSRGNLRCNDLWYVGDIVWDGTTGSFNSVDSVQPDDGGQCF